MRHNIKEEIDRELAGIQASEEKLQRILDETAQTGREQRKIPGARLALCVMLLAVLAAIPVSASVLSSIRGTTRITEENKDLVGQKQCTATETVPTEEFERESQETVDISSQYMTAEEAAEQTGGIIREVGVDESGNACLWTGQTITPIALKEGTEESSWLIEPLLSANGDVTVFTKEDGGGWYLKEGETLTIRYRIDPAATDGGDTENGERMSIGYIFNHTFCEAQLHEKAKEFTYALTAQEGGEYYFYNENLCAGYIYLAEGVIEIGR